MRTLVRTSVLIALVALAWPSSARAGTVSLDTYFQGLFASFVVAGEGPNGFVIGSVSMSQADGLGSLDALSSFEAYCVDFSTSVFRPTPGQPEGELGTYTAERGDMTAWSDGGTPPLTANGSGQRAAWLYQEYAGTFADVSTELGKEQRAALQMAIWNALYDNDFTVANTGATGNDTYFVNDFGQNLLTLAEFYLHGTGGVGGLEHAGASLFLAEEAWIQLRYTTGEDAQDFMGPVESTTVPEPSAGLLLGMGILSLAAFRSRKTLLRRA